MPMDLSVKLLKNSESRPDFPKQAFAAPPQQPLGQLAGQPGGIGQVGKARFAEFLLPIK